jgi:hypothetical protein
MSFAMRTPPSCIGHFKITENLHNQLLSIVQDLTLFPVTHFSDIKIRGYGYGFSNNFYCHSRILPFVMDLLRI